VNDEYALIEDHLVLQFTGMFHISLQPLTLNILLTLEWKVRFTKLCFVEQ